MKKVIVIGCPGAGKSIFSRALSKKTTLPLFHLDNIYHRPDRSTIPREEFDRRLSEIMSGDGWIIDGNYNRTLGVRFNACDTVFLLDYPTDVCITGAKSRIGTKRDDLPWIETELDREFEKFILEFKDASLPKIHLLISEHPEKEIHIFKSRYEAEKFLCDTE